MSHHRFNKSHMMVSLFYATCLPFALSPTQSGFERLFEHGWWCSCSLLLQQKKPLESISNATDNWFTHATQPLVHFMELLLRTLDPKIGEASILRQGGSLTAASALKRSNGFEWPTSFCVWIASYVGRIDGRAGCLALQNFKYAFVWRYAARSGTQHSCN